MSTLSQQNHGKKRSRYNYFPICKYNERLATIGRRFVKRRILTKMDNKRINWRFAAMANKGYPFDSLLRQIAETADFKSGKGSEDRGGGEGGEGEKRGEGRRREEERRMQGDREKRRKRRRERRSGCPWILADRRPPAVNDLTTLLYPAPLRSLPSLRFVSPRLTSPRLASLGLAGYPTRFPPAAAAAAATSSFLQRASSFRRKLLAAISANLGLICCIIRPFAFS